MATSVKNPEQPKEGRSLIGEKCKHRKTGVEGVVRRENGPNGVMVVPKTGTSFWCNPAELSWSEPAARATEKAAKGAGRS